MLWMVSNLPQTSSSLLFLQTLGNCSKGSTYNWYHCHLPVLQFFLSSLVRSSFSPSFIFLLSSAGIAKSTWWQVLFLLMSGLQTEIWWLVYILKPREFYAFHFQGQILVCLYTFCQSGEISVSYTIPNGSLSPLSCACSYISFVLVCFIIVIMMLEVQNCYHFGFTSKVQILNEVVLHLILWYWCFYFRKELRILINVS